MKLPNHDRARRWAPVLLIVGAVLVSAGCRERKGERAFYLTLVDMSGSTARDREFYRSEFRKVIMGLDDGDRLMVAPITDRSLSQFTPLLEKTVPKKHFFKDNPITFKERRKEFYEQLEHELDSVFQASRATLKTDILNSLLITGEILQRSQDRKVLVLFSDMLEENELNFVRQDVTDSYIKQALSHLKTIGHVADLASVEIYVVGAKAPDEWKYLQVKKFWEDYFRECRAILRSYMHPLTFP